MNISIIGAGNMGGAIAIGLAESNTVVHKNITVIDVNEVSLINLKQKYPKIQIAKSDYSSLKTADIIIIAVKPWMVEDLLRTQRAILNNPKQAIVSIAATISLDQLQQWTSASQAVFRVVPNTAIAVKQSMTYIAALNADDEKKNQVESIFGELGKTEFIDESLIPAITSLTSCGIAFAFRYIRAAMEGGVELGVHPEKAKEAVLQTIRGAIELLDANNSHPEAEIDKVTTAGGITIKGLNEMEHAGFSSAVIKGLKASNIK